MITKTMTKTRTKTKTFISHAKVAKIFSRRLYRDADNQLLGGVCSGLAHFFGFGDPVLWRLVVLLLFLFRGVGLLTYLILWLIVPLARTPEDKLRRRAYS